MRGTMPEFLAVKFIGEFLKFELDCDLYFELAPALVCVESEQDVIVYSKNN